MESCEAGRGGGGIYLLYTAARLRRTTFESCTAGTPFTHSRHQPREQGAATGEDIQSSGPGEGCGGGVTIHGGTLHASEVQVLRCRAHHEGGGLSIGSEALVVMSDSLVQECELEMVRGLGSAAYVSRGGTLDMANSSILRCHSKLSGTAYVEGNLTLSQGSELAECEGRDLGTSGMTEESRRGGVLWVRHGGRARLLRSSVRDNSVFDLSATETSFAVASVDVGGSLEVFHSVFENNSITSVNQGASGAAAVYVHRGASLLAVGMELGLACGAPLSKPAIAADSAAPPAPLPAVGFSDGALLLPSTSLRPPPSVRLLALRARNAPGCERSADVLEGLILGAHVSPPTCGANPRTCSPLASCADEEAIVARPRTNLEYFAELFSGSHGVSDLTTPTCACLPPFTPATGAPETDLAAYLPEYGCTVPAFVDTISVLDDKSAAESPDFTPSPSSVPNIVLELTKTSRNENISRSLLLHVGGTQEAALKWRVSSASVPRWLQVSPASGVLSTVEERRAHFLTVSVGSAGMREELEPLLATLNVTVEVGGVRETVLLPIYTIIATTATAATSMWGLPGRDGRCVPRREAERSPLAVTVGQMREVEFTSCDFEALEVAHSVPSLRTRKSMEHSARRFRVVLTSRESGEGRDVFFEYKEGGKYSAHLLAYETGEFTLRLYLDDELCGCGPSGAGRDAPLGCASLAISAVCPGGLIDTEGRSCGCAVGFELRGSTCVPQTTLLLLLCVACSVGLLLAVGVCRFAQQSSRNRKLAVAAALRERDEQRQRVREAIHNASTLKYPLCVMPFKSFARFGKLVPFEEARDQKVLVCCDTWDEAASFASTRPIIFLSHQWLSYCAPDPQNAHYVQMLRAVNALAAERGFSAEDCHVWVDYHSIPQCNEATKALAVRSIALFAACTSHFVACAPETPHVDTGLLCSRDTYLSRGWCRLEQWAFMLANGTESIYYCPTSRGSGGDAGSGGDGQLQSVSDVSSWIETSIMVFCGEFTNLEDKDLLVDVVLGLYGLAFVSRLSATGRAARPADSDGALWEQLQTHKAAIFPTELFGDLVELLETELTDAIAQAARGSGFGPQDSESSVSSHGGLKSKRRSETKQDAFALFDRHGFESVLRASDRLYTQAMREVRRTVLAAASRAGEPGAVGAGGGGGGAPAGALHLVLLLPL